MLLLLKKTSKTILSLDFYYYTYDKYPENLFLYYSDFSRPQ